MHLALLACLLSIVVIGSGCSSGRTSAESCRVVALAADLWIGAGSGDPNNVVALGDRLYFNANDGVHGEELWTYHPDFGAERLLDIAPGSGGSAPSGLMAQDGMLYFSADDGVFGRELWTYSPAEPTAGAVRVADINPGSGGSYPGELIEVNGRLFFEADDGVHGHELWMYDPAAGAMLVADLRTGVDASSIDDFTLVGGTLYFTAYGDRGRDLWFLDPTAGSVSRVDIHVDADQSSYTSVLTAFDGKLYFSSDDGIHGYELWSHDPIAGAALVADIAPGNDSSYPSEPTVMGDRLYLTANSGISSNELWVYDLRDGTVHAANLFPDVGDYALRNIHDLIELDGTLYFLARDDIHGMELWRFNPSTGATLVVDTVPGLGGNGDDDPEPPSRLRVFDNSLYFTAFDQASEYSRTQWILDPLTGPRILNEPWPGSGIDEIPWRTTELNGFLYFAADDDVLGRELWVYDPGCVR